LIPDKGVRAAILKQVDFRKERLLLFSWAGSSGDRLLLRGRQEEIAFEYSRGDTEDLHLHARLFAVPARAKVKVTAKAR
jgi:hypothetical protein